MATTSVKTDTHRSLKGWKEFHDYVRSDQNQSIDRVTNVRLRRFAARYRFSVNFNGVKADGIGSKTLEGYAAGIRLMMAYSAAELLCSAIGGEIWNWVIEDPSLAEKLRERLNYIEKSTEEMLDKAGSRAKLLDFLERRDDNLLLAARNLRHMIAHGSYTPNSVDGGSVAGVKAINSLADSVLQKCELEFNHWLNSRLRIDVTEIE